MFYVWLGLIALGWLKPVWQKIQRGRAESWPITTAQIESATITGGPQRKSEGVEVELSYSYQPAGKPENGTYKRKFYTVEEAVEFQRDLKGKPVAVHYNPNKPSKSAVSESSLETLIQARPPKTGTETILNAPSESSSRLAEAYLPPLALLSLAGLVLSLWVHIGAVMGKRVAPEGMFWLLHMGIFVVWAPAVWIAKKKIGNMHRKDFWKATLKGSPEWLRYMVYVFGAYAIANFAYFMTETGTWNGAKDTPAVVWRGFSGHWMAFYSGAFAILYSEITLRGNSRRCANGHPVPVGANYCTRCGQPVSPT
jgi:hypothetical protein